MKLVMFKNNKEGVRVFRDPSNSHSYLEGLYYSNNWKYGYTKNNIFIGYVLNTGTRSGEKTFRV